MIRLTSQFCKGASKLKECLDRMRTGSNGSSKQDRDRRRDIQAISNYVMRIRDCSQRFSAEQLDFDDDQRWSETLRTDMQNQQRDKVAQCLLSPCPMDQGQSHSGN
jgi:hypothetical protein